MSLLNKVKSRFSALKKEVMSLEEFLERLQKDPSIAANPAERMLKAIGEPELVDTSKDPRLSRLHSNKVIRVYKAFDDFYGMENTIDQIVSYFRHSAQGLEEKKQILYLLGPVGSAKSSLAERIKKLMEKEPIYVLQAGDDISPIFESPLGLFRKDDAIDLGISARYLNERLSPWANKRLKEFDGDITQFTVAKLNPSQAYQIAIARTEPGDENNQDQTALVGKLGTRKLVKFSEDDPDSYSFSGGLCLANQGILEFVEMFKAPIKMLHPLLSATQDGNYNGSESKASSSIPFEGVILAHSNETEWMKFRNDKTNEAFIDRVCVIKVPYSLSYTDEVKIYKKLIRTSSLIDKVCAPNTLEMLAKFSVLSRLFEVSNSDMMSKLRVYNGENVKEDEVKAKSYQEYRDHAGVNEGMTGVSTRFAYKVLSQTFNYDSTEISANPIHLHYVLEQRLEQEQLPKDLHDKYKNYLKGLMERYYKDLEHEIQSSYLESADEFGQNLFDRYVKFADYWLQEVDYRDPDTGELFDRKILDNELEKIEKPADISNAKDFRSEVVNFVLRVRANEGKK
jgi:serine protein kinase